MPMVIRRCAVASALAIAITRVFKVQGSESGQSAYSLWSRLSYYTWL